jgi:hypothetical protein
MFPEQTTYPQFAPNQVLSNQHLNDLFEYLDEQDRLTRTHLIGIGIVCGLEATYGQGENNFGINISKGCGVTSEGYLIRWDEDEALEYFTPYALPVAIDYNFFDLPDGTDTYPMWELKVADDDDPATMPLSEDFLIGVDQLEGSGDEKVLLLLFECKLLDNRNCTPNNCDDKGKTVETNVRPLLIRRQDLEHIREELMGEVPEVAAYYALHAGRANRLSLPSLHGPRWDVLNTRPVSTRDVFEAYRKMLSQDWLNEIQAALDQAYTALSPLLQAYSTNPFLNLVSRMRFLNDGRMLASEVALGYQYFYDHLMTILQAYAELRDTAEELFSLCCPDGRIFPRHLVLHHFDAGGVRNNLRHTWVSSPVQNQQSATREALLLYFDRLVLLVAGTELTEPAAGFGLSAANDFSARRDARTTGPNAVSDAVLIREKNTGTNALRSERIAAKQKPQDARAYAASVSVRPIHNFEKAFVLSAVTDFLGDASLGLKLHHPIRITPSFLGRALSAKALPYYYDPTLLLSTWNYPLTRRGRENENLGFDGVDWHDNNDFVHRPLRYDLEPRKFLRIEGAVGQPYLAVVREIQRQVNTYRLPIDVIALRTGSLTDDFAITDYQVQFADLEADYCQWRERFLGRMAELAARLYDIERLENKADEASLPRVAIPQAELLQRLDFYRYAKDTLGEFYEQHFDQHAGNAPFLQGLNGSYMLPMALLHLILQTEDAFAPTLRQLDYDFAQGGLTVLQAAVRSFASGTNNFMNEALPGDPPQNRFLDLKEFQDQLDLFVSSGDLAELRKIYAQYNERREEVLKRQLLSGFQKEHPGLQFKAGTELGGTFIVLYHGAGAEDSEPRTGNFTLTGFVRAGSLPASGAKIKAENSSLGTATRNNGYFRLNVNQLPTRLIIRDGDREPYYYWVSNADQTHEIDLNQVVPADNARPIPGITTGTVIADFYLPYRCCGKSAPIHIFPPAPEEPVVAQLRASAEQVTCTQRVGVTENADFSFTILGGTEPYFLVDEAGTEAALTNGQELNITNGGNFQVKDSGIQALPLTLELMAPLSLRPDSAECLKNNTAVQHLFTLQGGKPPYAFLNPQGELVSVAAGNQGELLVPAGEAFTLFVTDEFGENCALTHPFAAQECEDDGNDCDLPCKGIAISRLHRMWMSPPLASRKMTFRNFKFTWEEIEVEGARLTEEQLRKLNDEIRERMIFEGIQMITPENVATVNNIIIKLTELATADALNGTFGLPPEERPVDFSLEDQGRVPFVRIEHFACHEFNLVLNIDYVIFISNEEERAENANIIYTGETTTINGNLTSAISPAERDRCEDGLPLTSLVTGNRPKGGFTTRRTTEGRLFRLNAATEGKAVSWSFPPDTVVKNTPEGPVATFPEGVKSAVVRLVITDPETGAFSIKEKTIKV